MNVGRIVALALLVAGCTTSKNARPDGTANDIPPADCRCADGCVAACEVVDESTTYRKVSREPDAPDNESVAQEPPEAFDLWAERLEPVETAEIEKLAADLDHNASDISRAFRGDFVRGRGEEIAVVSRSGELAVYRDGSVLARLALGSPVGDPSIEGVQLVDQRAELIVRWEDDGVRKLTVCRVIGGAVARVFEIELTGRTVEFVHLGDERAIRVREADGSAVVYRWNPWEGMFRVPRRAPTAP